ncbi:MAG: DUF86 domain-containing protein [Sphingobium sp.]|nr:DUF86 domain-containing protein [Sphingobium sp.]
MDFHQYVADPKTMNASERCLERVIEATIKIGKDRMAIIAPDLPADAVRGLGNVLRHGYDQISAELIFATIRDRLPGLREACLRARIDDRP